MRVAVSNIAWLPYDDAAVGALLAELGCAGVEIAPTRYWPDPPAAEGASVAEVRRAWEERRLPVVALQSLLFARPSSAVFGDGAERAALTDYLAGVMRVAAGLGARPLVFGSPKNRLRGVRSMEDALADATSFFRALGDVAAAAGLVVAIEPNPPAYGCDFVTDTAQAVALLERVDHPAVGLHLDAGAIALNGEDPADAVARGRPWLRHVHCSEPNLVPIGTGGAPHAALARALRDAGYEGWVSVEMRAPAGDDAATVLRTSVATAVAAYGHEDR